jgi:hypothetical protein
MKESLKKKYAVLLTLTTLNVAGENLSLIMCLVVFINHSKQILR